jgi:Uma2 family endonuclease
MSRALALKKDFVSVEEYLAFEEKSKYRHEYLDGEIFQMAGGKYNHSLIASNIITEISINLRLKNKNCDVHGNDLRVKIDEINYVYPDVVVVCNPKLVPNIFDTLENPTIIFEITSKSTEFRDKETKLKIYLQLPGLTDYLIVSQKESRIEHYQRKSQKEWTYRVYTESDEIIRLKSIEGELSVAQIYRNVEFPVKLKIVKTKKK